VLRKKSFPSKPNHNRLNDEGKSFYTLICMFMNLFKFVLILNGTMMERKVLGNVVSLLRRHNQKRIFLSHLAGAFSIRGSSRIPSNINQDF
jgi:hypothetical protein